MKKLLKNILSLPRYLKRAIVMIVDITLCFMCLWLAFVIRLEELVLFKDLNLYSGFISIMIAIPILWLAGLYRTILRFASLSIFLTVSIVILIYGFLYFLVVGVYGIQGVPKAVGVIQPLLFFFAIMGSRLLVKYLFTKLISTENKSNKKNILVYGAGGAGRELVLALENSYEIKVVGFIDDNDQLHGQVILRKTVYSEKNLKKIIKSKDVSMVVLAIPSINRNKKNKIIERLSQHGLIVKTLPSVSELVDNRITVSDIKDFNIEDLLGRDKVEPDIKLLNKNIYSKTVLVTGAGGSIGSELCRQIVRLKPNKLILLELNEYSLYKINEELSLLNKKLRIIPLLVNVQEQTKLENILETFKVDTVYHAAAYKHVPLVEENICAGIKNNVFSTLAVAKASIEKKVSNLVLISSDKAVRPTNIMGASKRLSELCMQGIYNYTKCTNVNFSIVRFGNVLESSGSVIPKFKKQIKEGGPISLTHLDVTRYFMTISEAAQLVIQAGAMGKKSEVFVLDMGESIKIKDLIYQMVQLSGLTIKDNENQTGDIELKITGLRPGEKLFEEKLVGHNPQKTHHEKIQKENEDFILFDQLKIDLDYLYNSLENNKILDVIQILSRLVPSYKPNSKIVDYIYNEQLILRDDVYR
ncbi:nucleoside-diphosphate sugar epimerase/dehydratase [Alphaproteobacteria bacterium]|nr:nucleoside-diphosphate sugar epimerase/dehydratase [Alphaproteobacteria bacterium]